ncbi:hypothetical protein KFK09_003150 [Dendrobium nobile]|uniref:Uncharacterized protein n=1 Tax=Dendrobium nobile TaxID=94219 RepID=A0A8T3C9B4_DENNO|nr:hypothetical protein KFK09_003150 [Dendrobium nobile]
MNRHPVEITYQYCQEFLQLFTTGGKLDTLCFDPDFDWALTNHFLSNSNVYFHIRETSSLLKDAKTIQHILHTSVILKASDRVLPARYCAP